MENYITQEVIIMKNLDAVYKKCYVFNTILGVGTLAISALWWRRFLNGIEMEHTKTQETIRENVIW